MWSTVSFHKPKVYFDRHCVSPDFNQRWVSFDIQETDNPAAKIEITLWNPDPEFVRYLYGCNKPRLDETKSPQAEAREYLEKTYPSTKAVFAKEPTS